ncbi:putative lipoprotein [Bacteriovorax sp. BSW11_IV]|uniref:hypothetical protein n=1 Tax=Bacteriovorax sp. BSW11_IV TaxID=1353529 RepID=UPI00038A3E6E|nr:hypothetical protein [Bacteriovorax sp. BSW11_IV]EQC48506.1 putative lipoprotein [Bacteriovorax sp. BSW11_IV]
MIFSNKFTTVIALSALFYGCSASVDKKEETNKTTERLQVQKLSVLSQNDIREEASIDSIVTARKYTIQACLADGLQVKSLAGRSITLSNGKVLTTDVSGCVTWDKVVELDYKGQNNCHAFEESMSVEGSDLKTSAKYSLDPMSNTFSDLSRSSGCVGTTPKAQKRSEFVKAKSELILERIEIMPDGVLDIIKSDVKDIGFSAKYDTCLSSYSSGKRIRRANVEVSIRDPRTGKVFKKEAKTTVTGCLSGVFKSTYEQYGYSQWLDYDFSVRVLDGVLVGEEIGRKIYMNPWEQNRVTFAVDSDPEYGYGEVKENPIKRNNQIQIDGVMYILIGNDNDKFTVNDYLGLSISRSYQVVLNPRVDRGMLFTEGSRRYTELKDGRFKLSFMVLAPQKTDIPITSENFNDFTFITGAQKTVEVKNGVINDLISLQIKVTDLPKLATRTVTVFKLEPVNEIKLDGAIVTGFFKAKIPWIKTNVFKADDLNMSSEQAGLKNATASEKGVSLNTDLNLGSMVSEADIAKWKENILLGKNEENDFEWDQLNKSDSEFTSKQVAFKRYIEFLFSNITELTDKRTFDNPFKKSARAIFENHLAKTLPDVRTYKDLAQFKAQTKIDFTPTEIENVVVGNNDFSPEMIRKVCESVFPAPQQKYGWGGSINKNAKTEYCVRHPGKFFDIKKFRHIKKVKSINPLLATGFGFSVAARYNLAEGHQEQMWKNVRVGFDISTKFDALKFLTMGLRFFDFGMGKSWNDYENEGIGNDVSTYANVGVERFVIEVAGDYENCLLIYGKGYYNYSFGGYSRSTNPADYAEIQFPVKSYVCSEQKDTKVNESWYYMQEYTNDTSIMRDPFDPSTVKFIKVVRGYDKYIEIEKSLKDANKVFMVTGTLAQTTPDQVLLDNWGHLIDNPELNEDDKGFLLLDNIDGSFPGTIDVAPKPKSTRDTWWLKML